MPRELRVEYAGAMYHVMSRGDRREDLFLDDVDRQDFTKVLAECCQKNVRNNAPLSIVHSPPCTLLGELHRESAKDQAERILPEEMGRLGWSESDLNARPKGHSAKLAIAARLRQETTHSIKAIASRVHLGISKSANIRLHAAINGKRSAPPNQTELGL